MRRHGAYRGAYSGPYGPDAAYGGSYAGVFTPGLLRPYAWYDAELGQPKNVGYVELDGAAGDNIQTPDSAALSFSNDIEVVMRVRVDDWTAASNQTLCGKYVTTTNQRSWRFYVSTTGNIGLTASTNGTAVTSVLVTPTVALTDNAWIWLRLRLDLTDGSNSVGTVETSADTGSNDEPSSWTANGTNTSTTIASIFDSTSPLEIGAFSTGATERLTGQVGRCIVRNGFAGTTVADFNADQCYGPGYTGSLGESWALGLPKIYDRSGNGRAPATFGSGSNQPLWLPWTGIPSVYLPGASGNYVSCPDAAPLRITGDIEIVARLAMDSWTPGFNRSFVAKWNSGGNRAYSLQCAASTGRLSLYLSTTGSDQSFVESTVAPTVSNGSALWVKATFRLSDRRTQFFTAPDQASEPTSWTQLGSDVTHTATSIWAGSAAIEIGAINGGTSSALAGKVYQCIVRSGIGGTTVADFDAGLCGQSGYTDAYSNVWTVNRATSGRKTVVQSPVANSARSLILHGTDDYTTVPAAAVPPATLTDSGFIAFVGRQWNTPVSGAPLVSSRTAGTGAGLVNRENTTTNQHIWGISDGATTNADGPTSYTAGQRFTSTASWSTTLTKVSVNGTTDGTPSTRTVSGATANDLYVASRPGLGQFQDLEFEAVVMGSYSIADPDNARLVAYYRGGL